jgi:hypothetical protein
MGFALKKNLEVDSDYHGLLGWNVLSWYSIVGKVWLCQCGQLGQTWI